MFFTENYQRIFQKNKGKPFSYAKTNELFKK